MKALQQYHIRDARGRIIPLDHRGRTPNPEQHTPIDLSDYGYWYYVDDAKEAIAKIIAEPNVDHLSEILKLFNLIGEDDG